MERAQSALPHPSQRTRLGNGKDVLLDGSDERTVYVRRLKEVVAEMLDDMGGVTATSAAQRSLIRRAAVLQIELEKLETRFAEDPTVGERTIDLYGRTAGNLRRTLETLGIKRVTQQPQTITGYLANKGNKR